MLCCKESAYVRNSKFLLVTKTNQPYLLRQKMRIDNIVNEISELMEAADVSNHCLLLKNQRFQQFSPTTYIFFFIKLHWQIIVGLRILVIRLKHNLFFIYLHIKPCFLRYSVRISIYLSFFCRSDCKMK